MNNSIPVELGELQDPSFSSPQEAFDHMAMRDRGFGNVRQQLIGRSIASIHPVDPALRILIDDNFEIELFVEDRVVSVRSDGSESRPALFRSATVASVRMLWHPLDPSTPAFEDNWNRPTIVQRLLHRRIQSVMATETSIRFGIENESPLLCMPCRHQITGEYFVYWDFEE